ncbi:GNAT family N-acetyltransferase [Streptomyces sp. Ru87]|uniref:GNAT family N-acetyltransferase n=1 Tax=Streptomyces sp. Ru87 TaxID=2044307 RepID=UPI000BF91A0B|nr:GNAT family N-acetyltransferase [Streptomyces sp. Ru87]PGH49904.1 GNAT family N-acetyltransferase [Streptomyces sp. Ru87]
MPQGGEVQVRPGREGDLEALTDLYNHYIRETPVTFDTVPLTPEQRRPWLHSHPKDGPHRLLVATEIPGPGPGTDPGAGSGTDRGTRCGTGSGTEPGPGERILGYATSSPFRPKPAYGTSVETTVYCAPDALGRGVGSLLYTRLFEELAGEDLRRAYAGIALPNAASVRLHERFGFGPVGTFHEAGRKFGRYWDVAWFERRCGAA